MTDDFDDVRTRLDRVNPMLAEPSPFNDKKWRNNPISYNEMNELLRHYVTFLCCELRNQNKAILEALKNVNGSKYHRTVESDGQRISYGADTLDELNAMIGEPVNYMQPHIVSKER